MNWSNGFPYRHTRHRKTPIPTTTSPTAAHHVQCILASGFSVTFAASLNVAPQGVTFLADSTERTESANNGVHFTSLSLGK